MKKLQKENSENKAKRQRRVVGSVMEINVNNAYYVYAQSYPYNKEIIFDYRTTVPLDDLSILLTTKELFRVCVYSSVISQSHWIKVGKLPLRQDLLPPKKLFLYHPYDKVKYEIYDPLTNKISKATKEECVGLELMAIWDYGCIEERIRDHYNGVRCRFLEDEYESGVLIPPEDTEDNSVR